MANLLTVGAGLKGNLRDIDRPLVPGC